MNSETALDSRPSPAAAILAWAGVAVWMGVIFYMSTRTGIKVFSWMTYVAHFGEYMILGLLLCVAMYLSTKLDAKTLLMVALVVASAYGISDEFHQAFVPTRNPDVVDWLTDTIGAGVGVVLFAAALRLRAGRRALQSHHSES